MKPHLPLTISGGTGGAGGGATGENGQGGSGGAGLGPTLNFERPENIIIQALPFAGQHSDDMEHKIRDWIAPIDFFRHQHDFHEAAQATTGNWILENPMFQEWKAESTTHKILRCHGSSGVGKTLLMSHLVHHLEKMQKSNPKIGIAYLYLNKEKEQEQALRNLLAALWRHLALHHAIEPAIQIYYQNIKKQTLPTIEEILELLSSAMKAFSNVYILIDGLDQYPASRTDFVRKILHAGSNTHLLIMCQTQTKLWSYLMAEFQPFMKHLEIIAHKDEITAFILAELDNLENIKILLAEQEDMQQLLIERIISKANGIFRHVKHLLCSLNKATTLKELNDSLNKLSINSGDSHYEQVLRDMEEQSPARFHILQQTLFWTTYAKQPLTVTQMQTVLALLQNSNQLPAGDTVMPVDIILTTCAGLVVKEEMTDILRPVDGEAIQMVLMKQQLARDIHTKMAEILLSYLKLAHKEDWAKLTDTELRQKAPLIEYCQYLFRHVSGPSEDALRDKLLEYFNNFHRYSNWHIEPWQFVPWPSNPGPSAQWLAVAGNLPQLAQWIIENQPHERTTELSVALKYGYDTMIQVLQQQTENPLQLNNQKQLVPKPSVLQKASEYYLHFRIFAQSSRHHQPGSTANIEMLPKSWINIVAEKIFRNNLLLQLFGMLRQHLIHTQASSRSIQNSHLSP
uniref:Nephrocystin 3-like N-terminal domain-containing protein n=1 Tax=Mycena chlorophos TaxID=658473 RepID=A0ABQ0LI51_MYCCL|nr:predicted protein [Mycena chlorophos]